MTAKIDLMSLLSLLCKRAIPNKLTSFNNITSSCNKYRSNKIFILFRQHKNNLNNFSPFRCNFSTTNNNFASRILITFLIKIFLCINKSNLNVFEKNLNFELLILIVRSLKRGGAVNNNQQQVMNSTCPKCISNSI